ncbi:hypothetical protein AB0K12_09550 [Nonomuraea sp. NPDC049419]|uniref:hypothetical protein n=1 Tax=Nonomuraea sp. NPDC049419 TaxID=3155772 RepID=UPI00343DEEA3
MYGSPSVFGAEATVAAWRHGDAWPAETLALLDRNRRTIAARLPETSGHRLPEATCLAWLEAGRPGMVEVIEHEARIRLNDGAGFGPGGEHHVRLTFATTGPSWPRSSPG